MPEAQRHPWEPPCRTRGTSCVQVRVQLAEQNPAAIGVTTKQHPTKCRLEQLRSPFMLMDPLSESPAFGRLDGAVLGCVKPPCQSCGNTKCDPIDGRSLQ